MIKDGITELGSIIFAAKDHGAKYVMLEFSGGGDSGDIDSCKLIPEELIEFKKETLERKDEEPEEVDGFSLKHHTWESEFSDIMDKYTFPAITQEAQDEIWGLLHEPVHKWDWWNNDGGSGTAVLNLETMQYHVEFHINYTTSEQYNENGKLELEKNGKNGTSS